jgi:methyl-accepting chemotaxis protein
MKDIFSSNTTLYKDRVMPLAQLKHISDAYAVNIVDALHKARNAQFSFAEAATNLEAARSIIVKEWKDYSSTYLTEKEKELSARTAQQFVPADQTIEKALIALKKADTQMLLGIIRTEMYQNIDPVTGTIQELIELQLAVANQEYIESGEHYDSAILREGVLALVSLFLTIVLAAIIIRSITNPLHSLIGVADKVAAGDMKVEFAYQAKDETGKLAIAFSTMLQNLRMIMQQNQEHSEYLQNSVSRILQAMKRFEEGDLSARLDVERQDEIGVLCQGFNHTVESVHQVIARIQESIQVTARSAGQISSATVQLAGAAQEQSSQTVQVAAAVEQMNRTIADASQNASRTANHAEINGSVAKEGVIVLDTTIGKIREIATIVAQSVESIERLGRSSSDIGQIVSVIEDIADQTNLLALNAAIEAARAGEQGRGFAIVADEVRKLAERTTNATKQISSMIKDIQKETVSAVKLIQKGNNTAEQGIELADKANASLGKIVDSAGQVMSMVQQLAAANEELSMTSEDMARSIEAISHVSGESAGSISGIAGTAGELENLTTELQEIIEHFELGNSMSVSPRGRLLHA